MSLRFNPLSEKYVKSCSFYLESSYLIWIYCLICYSSMSILFMEVLYLLNRLLYILYSSEYVYWDSWNDCWRIYLVYVTFFMFYVSDCNFYERILSLDLGLLVYLDTDCSLEIKLMEKLIYWFQFFISCILSMVFLFSICWQYFLYRLMNSNCFILVNLFSHKSNLINCSWTIKCIRSINIYLGIYIYSIIKRN